MPANIEDLAKPFLPVTDEARRLKNQLDKDQLSSQEQAENKRVINEVARCFNNPNLDAVVIVNEFHSLFIAQLYVNRNLIESIQDLSLKELKTLGTKIFFSYLANSRLSLMPSRFFAISAMPSDDGTERQVVGRTARQFQGMSRGNSQS